MRFVVLLISLVLYQLVSGAPALEGFKIPATPTTTVSSKNLKSKDIISDGQLSAPPKITTGLTSTTMSTDGTTESAVFSTTAVNEPLPTSGSSIIHHLAKSAIVGRVDVNDSGVTEPAPQTPDAGTTNIQYPVGRSSVSEETESSDGDPAAQMGEKSVPESSSDIPPSRALKSASHKTCNDSHKGHEESKDTVEMTEDCTKIKSTSVLEETENSTNSEDQASDKTAQTPNPGHTERNSGTTSPDKAATLEDSVVEETDNSTDCGGDVEDQTTEKASAIESTNPVLRSTVYIPSTNSKKEFFAKSGNILSDMVQRADPKGRQLKRSINVLDLPNDTTAGIIGPHTRALLQVAYDDDKNCKCYMFTSNGKLPFILVPVYDQHSIGCAKSCSNIANDMFDGSEMECVMEAAAPGPQNDTSYICYKTYRQIQLRIDLMINLLLLFLALTMIMRVVELTCPSCFFWEKENVTGVSKPRTPVKAMLVVGIFNIFCAISISIVYVVHIYYYL